MTWKDFVYDNVVEYCNSVGSRTFSLHDFLANKLTTFRHFRPKNAHVEAKIRQQLQFLRDEEKINFLDNSGHYTLRGVDLLQPERDETASIDLRMERPEQREYIVETYVRNVGWALSARKRYGCMCMCERCSNTFFRDDGTKYVEVHHIVPLCLGGEDGLWNLAVLCAHHHRMAHYADMNTRLQLQHYLLDKVRRKGAWFS